MKERAVFFSIWQFVIVYSCHEFGCNNFPNKGMRIIISDDVRPGLTALMRCTDEIADVCSAGLLTNFREDLPQLRKLPFNIRLRGGKGIQGDGAKKRHRKTLGAEEVDQTVDNTNSILYQPGGAGFGKVEVVTKPQNSMMPNMEDFPEGGAPMFEVNLTEIRENQDDSGTDNNPKEYSHREWWRNASSKEIMTYLRAQDPERTPDEDTNPDLNADLAWAAGRGDAERVAELVAAGAQVNAGGAGGSSQWTALHHAARGGYEEAVVRLLELGARANVATWGRWTALHWACMRGDVGVARALLDRGADVYAVNSDGNMPMDLADEDDEDVRELLVQRGYLVEVALDRKAAASFIIPQYPRRKDGLLAMVEKMSGRPCEMKQGREEVTQIGDVGPDGTGEATVTTYRYDDFPTPDKGLPDDLEPMSKPDSSDSQ